MTELLRQWIIGVTCAAIAAALMQALTPKGGAGKAGQLAAGLLLLLAAVKPLTGISLTDAAEGLEALSLRQEERAAELTEENRQLMKALIEGETETYILDKARELEITCTAAAFCQAEEDGGYRLEQVVISGAMTAEQKQTLFQCLEGELGLQGEQIRWEQEEG